MKNRISFARQNGILIAMSALTKAEQFTLVEDAVKSRQLPI
jgi:hypothetical protein